MGVRVTKESRVPRLKSPKRKKRRFQCLYCDKRWEALVNTDEWIIPPAPNAIIKSLLCSTCKLYYSGKG